jgi:hypothetical protein
LDWVSASVVFLLGLALFFSLGLDYENERAERIRRRQARLRSRA